MEVYNQARLLRNSGSVYIQSVNKHVEHLWEVDPRHQNDEKSSDKFVLDRARRRKSENAAQLDAWQHCIAMSLALAELLDENKYTDTLLYIQFQINFSVM